MNKIIYTRDSFKPEKSKFGSSRFPFALQVWAERR